MHVRPLTIITNDSRQETWKKKGRLGFFKAFAATSSVSVVVVAVDAPDMGGVCAMAWKEPPHPLN